MEHKSRFRYLFYCIFSVECILAAFLIIVQLIRSVDELLAILDIIYFGHIFLAICLIVSIFLNYNIKLISSLLFSIICVISFLSYLSFYGTDYFISAPFSANNFFSIFTFLIIPLAGIFTTVVELNRE